MFKRLSLQARLTLFLSGTLGLTFVAAIVALLAFSSEQLEEEHAIAVGLVKQFSDVLNLALQNHPESHDIVAKLISDLPRVETGRLNYIPAAETFDPTKVQRPAHDVPYFFEWLIGIPTQHETFPIMIDGRRIGAIVFVPDLSADFFEKWVAFLALVATGILVTGAGSLIATRMVRTALRPVHELANGIAHLDRGDYKTRIVCEGPPEIERSCEALNDLAVTLQKLSDENARLLRRTVEIHDEERTDLARELHDELGPQLFAIRASALALEPAHVPLDRASALSRMLEAATNLQRSNRRILDRLRPMHVQELGLIKSVEGLLRDAQAQAPDMQFAAKLAPELGALDPMTAQTIYRIVQEAITNVLRHAHAKAFEITSSVDAGEVQVTLSDDGRGFGEKLVPGRGLTGMQERVRALGGAFALERRQNCTVLSVSLPVRGREPAPPLTPG